MNKYYYGINEGELSELLKTGALVLSKECLKTISLSYLCTKFSNAISQSSMNIYKNKAEKIVILELEFNEDVSAHFYLRRTKIISLNNVTGYYVGDNVSKELVYQLEASLELSLSYEDVFSNEFVNSLVCADEYDIYKHINLKGIETVDINTVMDKKKLDNFINEVFNQIGDKNNYKYTKLK